jgi:hypothetical protein
MGHKSPESNIGGCFSNKVRIPKAYSSSAQGLQEGRSSSKKLAEDRCPLHNGYRTVRPSAVFENIFYNIFTV